jgi:hypothetical protein
MSVVVVNAPSQSVVVATTSATEVIEIARGIQGPKGDPGPAGEGTGVPTLATKDFIILENTQALFAEEIQTNDFWIEILQNAILREVK